LYIKYTITKCSLKNCLSYSYGLNSKRSRIIIAETTIDEIGFTNLRRYEVKGMHIHRWNETVMWKSRGSETMCKIDCETGERSLTYETVRRKETSPVYSSVYPRANRNSGHHQSSSSIMEQASEKSW
jgi:hypothetical protein